MDSIWTKLPQPFFALAPMDDVTDTVFRQVLVKAARPDLFFSEFVSADGLVSEKGFSKLSTKLRFSEIEKPIIAQIWGSKPENIFKAAEMVKEMGFDGLDINLGCPDRKVMKAGGGGALIGQESLVNEIIVAAKEGAGRLPLSVKTRLGIREIETEKWLGFLLRLGLDAITVHGRTVAELSKVPAWWDEIGKVVVVRNSLECKTKIIGNGDIKSYQEGLEKAKKYGVDGIMVGRGVFENPWIFRKDLQTGLGVAERLKLCLYHLDLFNKIYQGKKCYAVLKKYFKIYIQGFKGASKVRMRLMETNNIEEAIEIAKGMDDRGKAL